MRKQVAAERARIIKKMNSEKRWGASVTPGMPTYGIIQSCDEHNHSHGLFGQQTKTAPRTLQV